MFSISLLLLPLLLVQSSYAETFTDLKGEDLDGNIIRFSRYENKCVLLAQVSPYIFTSNQVIALNDLYDKFSKKGIENV